MKRRQLLAAVCAAFVSVVALPSGTYAQNPPKKIQFLTNYVYNGRHAPFFVGLDKGYYKEAGFDIQIAPATGSGFVIAAVDGGKADYGMADVSSVVQGLSKGAKLKAFMVYTDVSTNGLASLTPLPTPESVMGKKVAASQTDSVRVILPIIFDDRKLDISKVQWQSADPGVYFSLLLSGQVDAITASSDGDMPALTKTAATQNKAVQFSAFSDWGYDIYGYVLVTGASAIQQNPDEAKRFMEATKKAVAYSIANPAETADIMVKYNTTMNRDTVFTQWSGTIKSMQTPYAAQHGYGVATDERINRSIALTKKALKFDADLKAEDLFAIRGR
jgi:NitT/TauT family transport system substrate-binding protein